MLYAFFLTFVAGFATFIGGFISFFIKKENTKLISFVLAFSAGVMIYISFMDLLPLGIERLERISPHGKHLAIFSFFCGMVLYSVIDRFLPDNSHEGHDHAHFHKLGLISFLSVTIHNFPEGMTVFSVAMEKDVPLAFHLIFAIALHNIPEGIIIATSFYLMTGSKWKALIASFFSGLAEPIGGIIGYSLFSVSFKDYSLGVTFSFIAGMMIFLSMEQLLPQARKIKDSHFISYGLILGMMVMALSI